MKKTLIIGSTVLDIIIEVTNLPSTAEDVHITNQSMAIGGCAFNVRQVLNHFNIPHLFCFPVGTGMYGNYVKSQLSPLNLQPFITIEDQDNGCCYCYVEPHGERTFMSYHGAEYVFKESWLDSINMSEFDSVYVCGLELEEPTGWELISFLEKNAHLDIYFAPGPRICMIDSQKMDRLLSLSPIIHLNKDELLSYTQAKDIEGGCSGLHDKTNNDIIVTHGAYGSYLYHSSLLIHAPTTPVEVVDTIGAGDGHLGALISAYKSGLSLQDSLSVANRVSGEIVAIQGGQIPNHISHDPHKLL